MEVMAFCNISAIDESFGGKKYERNSLLNLNVFIYEGNGRIILPQIELHRIKACGVLGRMW